MIAQRHKVIYLMTLICATQQIIRATMRCHILRFTTMMAQMNLRQNKAAAVRLHGINLMMNQN